MPGWIIRPADEVVQGNIEEVGKTDEDRKRRLLLPLFIVLIAAKGQANAGGNIFLQQLAFLLQLQEPFGKSHENTSSSGRIIRSADEVIQGDIEEVGKGDENQRGRDSFAVFVSLIGLFCNADSIGHLFLSSVFFKAVAFQSIGQL